MIGQTVSHYGIIDNLGGGAWASYAKPKTSSPVAPLY